MKPFSKILILTLLVSVASQSHCPPGLGRRFCQALYEAFCPTSEHERMYRLIEANVNKYAAGVIQRKANCWPSMHFMWQKLSATYDDATAKIIHAETYAVLFDIVNLTNQYWNAKVGALAVGYDQPIAVDAYSPAERIHQGNLAHAKALDLLNRDATFKSTFGEFDYRLRPEYRYEEFVNIPPHFTKSCENMLPLVRAAMLERIDPWY